MSDWTIIGAILGVGVTLCSMTTILVNGWVKAKHISDLRMEVKKEFDLVWKALGELATIPVELGFIKASLDEVKSLVKEKAKEHGR